jgi:adenine C2-methylase RlmN of 23S rRNA A2503 and tRNA A37
LSDAVFYLKIYEGGITMNKVQKSAMNLILGYLSSKPLERIPTMLNLAETLDRKKLNTSAIQTLREVLTDEDSMWRGFTERLFKELDPKVLRKAVECFMINASLEGSAVAAEAAQKYDCNIPWAILMDPTSACNLNCTGCWAAQYGDKNNLGYETLDSISTIKMTPCSRSSASAASDNASMADKSELRLKSE